jgi:transposase-like protein
MAEGRKRRQRRRFTDEFKAEVVKKVLSSGKTAGQVARDLDLTETAVRSWVKQAQVDRGKGPLGELPDPIKVKGDPSVIRKYVLGTTGPHHRSHLPR